MFLSSARHYIPACGTISACAVTAFSDPISLPVSHFLFSFFFFPSRSSLLLSPFSYCFWFRSQRVIRQWNCLLKKVRYHFFVADTQLTSPTTIIAILKSSKLGRSQRGAQKKFDVLKRMPKLHIIVIIHRLIYPLKNVYKLLKVWEVLSNHMGVQQTE